MRYEVSEFARSRSHDVSIYAPKLTKSASGSESGDILIWNIQTKRLVSVIETTDEKDPVLDIDASQNGQIMVSITSSGILQVWDTEQSEKMN